MIIIVTPHHKGPKRPIDLGEEMLVLVNEDQPSESFRLLCDAAGQPTEATVLLGDDEAYKLHISLHILFAGNEAEQSVV